MSFNRLLCGLAVAAAVLAFTACSESPTAPASLANPAATTASLAALDGTLRSPAAQSFTVFAGAMVPRPGVFAAAALAGATSPVASSAQRARLLGPLAPALDASAASFQIIPDTLRGSVFRWDSAASGYYRAGVSGGPANGVRFILYAVTDGTRQISYPLTEVGYADLLDESSDAGLQLHILVKSVDGSVTYVDQTVTIAPAPNGFAAAARGFVSNGQPGSENRTLRFVVNVVASATATGATATVSGQLGLNSPAVTFALTERHTFTASGGAVSRDFALSQPGETIELTGTVVLVPVAPDSATVVVNATILVNGAVLASVQGTPPDHLTFRDGAGQPLPPGPVLDALGQLSRAADGVGHFIQGVFSPIGNVLGGL